MLIALLVGMVVCSVAGMTVVEGRPVSADLLTGREFLEVYMRRQPHFLRHNTIPHKDDEHYNDISSSSLDAEDLSEEDDEDEEESDESTSEQPDLITTTESDESETTTTTDEPSAMIIETTRAERSTTEADWRPEEHPSQVVSVRVSSSVVRKKPENLESHAQEEKKISVSYRIEAKATDSFPSASHDQENFSMKPNASDYTKAEALTYQNINIGSDPQNSPVSYETSVSSASSDSSVRFYREPPRYEYRTEGSDRQQRNFQESVFGQRQKPFPKQELYKTESRQIFSETERNFPSSDIYRTTPSRPFDKTETIFVKTTETFGKPSQEVYEKLNNDYNKDEVFSKQDEIFSKTEQIYNKPQQIYSKQEVDYIKTEQDFSKLPEHDNLYGKRKQPFTSRQDFSERISQRDQDLGLRQSSSIDQDFGKKRDFSHPSFGKREPEAQESFPKPQQNYPLRGQPERSRSHPEKVYSEPEKVFAQPEKVYSSPEKVYSEPEKVYSDAEKMYGQPEKVYGEPEKVYGEPEKVYAEPEKIYGEPEKVYGKPAKNYGKPEKDFGEPENVYGEREKIYNEPEKGFVESEKIFEKPEKVYGEPEKVFREPEKAFGQPEKVYGEPERNYEVDEAVSVRTNGRTHGVQTPSSKDDKHKFGYVEEGQNYRKYRVEERTSDGFIVGEYGVVSHNDGSLRGVRYTADSNINPRLIYDALVKFLSLK